MVIDEINKNILLCFWVNTLLNILSAINKSIPPEKKPRKVISHGVRFNS